MPNTFWFAIPNGGGRSAIEGAILKATGVRPGTPDMCFIHDGQPFFLELKAPGGRPTGHQLDAIAQITAAGGQARITVGVDEALEVLQGWGLLRGKAS